MPSMGDEAARCLSLICLLLLHYCTCLTCTRCAPLPPRLTAAC